MPPYFTIMFHIFSMHIIILEIVIHNLELHSITIDKQFEIICIDNLVGKYITMIKKKSFLF
jgi:hypothetical protein